MATRNNTNIRLNFTGNNELDRYNIFNYIIENFTPDQTEAEILVLAATFLANSYQEIVNEIRANPDMLVPVCLYLMVEEKISIIRRADIGNALVHYSDNYAKTLEQKANKKPLFNFTNEYEKLLFSRLSQQNSAEVAVEYPFFKVYYERGLIYETLNDYNNAFRMFSKAHQWNPFNPKAVTKILDGLKYDRRADDLMRLGYWYLQVVYSLPNISSALRYCGYSLYLDGEFEKAYAFYFQSIVYSGDTAIPDSLNKEISSVLSALKQSEPYELKMKDLKKMFAYSKEKPFPSEIVFDTIRTLIIDHYTHERYTDVLRYATNYVVYRPNDEKITRILNVSKLRLN